MTDHHPRVPDKVTIRFLPIGSVDMVSPRVISISKIATVLSLSRYLSGKLNTAVHLYVQNLFSPTPDEIIADLYSHFKTNNELIISYCQTLAFG